MRRALLLALTLLPLLAPRAAAQEEQAPRGTRIRVSTRVGLALQGDLRPGWVPIEVELDNPRESQSVILELRISTSGRLVLSCEREIVVPAKGKRRDWFYLPFTESAGVVSTVVWTQPGAGGKRTTIARITQGYRASSRLSRRTAMRPVQVLYVGGHPGTERRDATMVISPGASLDVRPASRLPSHAFAYQGIELIALHGADLSAMSQEARRALTLWVRSGGTLLLIPGRQVSWFATPTIKEFLGGAEVRSLKINRLSLLEKRLGRLSDLPWSQRAPFEVFPVTPTEAQRKAAAPLPVGRFGGRRARTPLPLKERLRYGHTFEFLERLPCGQGWVFVLAADLSQPPFDRWTGLPKLVRAAHARIDRVATGADRASLLNRAQPLVRPEVCRALRSTEDPDKTLVILLVVVYILCVGPLNFYYLRQRDRPLLLALTVPAISLVFSAMVVISGYVTKGLGTVVWRVSVVSTELGSADGLEQTALSIRSSVERSYAITMEAPLLGTRVFPGQDELLKTPVRMRQEGGGTRFPAIPLGMWEQAVFEGQARKDLKQGLRVVWSAQGTPDLINGTDQVIQRAVILGGTKSMFQTGRVEPGQRVTASRVFKTRLASRGLAPSRSARVLAEDPAQRDLISKALERYWVFRKRTGVVALLERPTTTVKVDGDADADRSVALLVAQGDAK